MPVPVSKSFFRIRCYETLEENYGNALADTVLRSRRDDRGVVAGFSVLPTSRFQW